MVGVPFTNNTYDCTCNEEYYAYVYPNEWGYIYLCNVFWDAPATGTDSKAGTLVHESSHFTNIGSTGKNRILPKPAHFSLSAAVDDWAYGQSAAKSLAISNPTRAVDNADSHEYFAENTPSLP